MQRQSWIIGILSASCGVLLLCLFITTTNLHDEQRHIQGLREKVALIERQTQTTTEQQATWHQQLVQQQQSLQVQSANVTRSQQEAQDAQQQAYVLQQKAIQQQQQAQTQASQPVQPQPGTGGFPAANNAELAGRVAQLEADKRRQQENLQWEAEHLRMQQEAQERRRQADAQMRGAALGGGNTQGATIYEFDNKHPIPQVPPSQRPRNIPPYMR